MSVAVFIVPEREVPGLDTEVSGKALARSRLDRRDPGNGLRRLEDFFSVSPEEAQASYEDLGGDPDALPEGGFPPEQWFPASDGLATVRSLIAYLEGHPNDTRNAPAVMDDLRDFERVLAALAQASVRWHLAIDY